GVRAGAVGAAGPDGDLWAGLRGALRAAALPFVRADLRAELHAVPRRDLHLPAALEPGGGAAGDGARSRDPLRGRANDVLRAAPLARGGAAQAGAAPLLQLRRRADAA